MRNLVLLVGLILALAVPAKAEDAPNFSSLIEDLPLAGDLMEVGEGIEFSNSSGRIAEVNAVGNMTQKSVLAFYDATLPQLGWEKTDDGVYVREGEMLSLTFENSEDGLHVRFSLSPSSTPHL